MTGIWKFYYPDDSETAEDAREAGSWVRCADFAAHMAVEHDWSDRDGWERKEGREFAVVVISPEGEEIHYVGYHEPDVNHVARRVK